MPSTNQSTFSPSVKEELQFRASLLRLMTVPHEGSAALGYSEAAKQLDALQVAVPVRKRSA